MYGSFTLTSGSNDAWATSLMHNRIINAARGDNKQMFVANLRTTIWGIDKGGAAALAARVLALSQARQTRKHITNTLYNACVAAVIPNPRNENNVPR